MPTLKLNRVVAKKAAVEAASIVDTTATSSHAAAELRPTEDDAATANDEEDDDGNRKTTNTNIDRQEEEESDDVFYDAVASLAEDSSTHSQVTIVARKKKKTDDVINLCDDSMITSVVKNNDTTERPSRACKNKKRCEIDFSLLDDSAQTYSKNKNNIKMEPYYSDNDNNSNSYDDSTNTIIASKRISGSKGIQTAKQYVKDEYSTKQSVKDEYNHDNNNNDNREDRKVSSVVDRSTISMDSIPIIEGYGSNISNLSKVEPKVNMLLDLLDDDNIWNIARIIHVSHVRVDDISNTWKCYVTLRYEGWLLL
jgi:hypothetical protein